MPGWLGLLTRPVSKAVRAQQIGYALSRYGLGGILAAVGLEVGKRGLNVVGISTHAPVRLDAVFGVQLARTFVHLGPTFVKLGQVLASRPDLVGDAVSEELKVLFNRVPPVKFAALHKQLKKELGRETMKRAFQSIDPTPLASASLSQTHTAVLKGGTPVILKIQKPGVSHLVRIDLELLKALVIALHSLSPSLQLRQIFEDFKQATLNELDYRLEGKNIDRFRKNYRRLLSASYVRFPKYYPELTTEKVITLEPMRGRPVIELKKGSTVARLAAEQSLAAVLEQIFDHGFFHADPHSGNLFFQEDDGGIGFIDLGLVGQLHPDDKKKFLKVLLGILKRDPSLISKSLFALGKPGKNADADAFEKAVSELFNSTTTKGGDRRLDKLLNELLSIARKCDIHVPNRYILMMRSCLVVEGLAKSLDPNISLVQVAVPIVAKSLMRSYNPLSLFWRK